MTAAPPNSSQSLSDTYTPGAHPKAISPKGGGGKFAPDGSVLPFPGNTILCHIQPGTKAHDGLVELQNRAKAAPWAQHFTFLPPASFHMTLFEGICMNPAFRGAWPKGIGRRLPRDRITEKMLGRLDGLYLPERHRIAPIGIRHQAGLSLHVAGATEADEASLRECRRQLRDRLRLVPPGFDSYGFHVTLAYLLHWIEDDLAEKIGQDVLKMLDSFRAEVPVIELGPPEFCNFEDMHAFQLQRLLSR